ncbi:MAG: nucleotidyltransferase family protein [Bacteroidales bacterium]|nr:nucleotidyltransferase family protein [Bacteroidales bacterium]
MHIQKPSNEQQLLFKLLKGDPPTSLEGINTANLFDLFRRHRLFPLASDLLPLLVEGERERWKKAIQFRTIRSMHHIAVLGQLTEALGKAGIEAIPIKGPVLAHVLFGNIGERHSSDLDILVRKEDLQRSIEIIGREGFVLTYPNAGLSDRQWKYYSRYKKDIGLFSKEHGLLIELHYSIENYMGLKSSDVDLLVQQPVETGIGGMLFKTMNNHQTFLYLIFHGAVHQYRRLFWLRDIAVAINRWELDHRKILEDAQRMGIERMVGVSVELVRDLFNVELPEAYSAYLAENRRIIGKLKQTSMGMILGSEYPAIRGKLRHHLFMLRLKPEISHYFRTAGEIFNRLYIGRFMGGH